MSEPLFYKDFEHADYHRLNDYLCGVDWNSIFQYCFDAEQCWCAFICVINNAIQLFIPLKRCRPIVLALWKLEEFDIHSCQESPQT